MMRRLSVLFAFVLAALVAGCGTSSETVTVTQRPEPIPSTEDATEPAPEPVVSMPAGYDTVQAKRFDQGKMWTFDNPPKEYLEEAYAFSPDSTWFRRARLGALRFGSNCSASFVSPHGLVMTNHHCGRESISKVSRPDEDLLDNGFYAPEIERERKVPELYVEQLVKIEDVTQRVYGERNRPVNDMSAQNRQQRVSQLQDQMTEQAKQRNEHLRVEIVSLYSGSQYSAYTYRRYEDVRLVMAPALRLGFFGGTPDNFTYPRFALDVSFFRVYGDDGSPLRTTDYFQWNTEGISEGEAVFVVGNPGSTNRLSTVSQLKFARTYELPQQLDALQARADLLDQYIAAHPDSAQKYELRNLYFSIQNSIKSTRGQVRGLNDPYLIARRAASEKKLAEAITSTDSLRSEYGNLFSRIQQLQQTKRVTARRAEAFTFFTSSQLGSRILTRGVYGYFSDLLRRRGAPQSRLEEIKEQALSVENWPPEIEKEFIALRLRTVRNVLGAEDPTVRKIMGERTPEQIAERLVANSALMDSTSYAALLDNGYLNSKDASVPVVQALAPLFLSLNQQRQDYRSTEDNLNARLAQVRFDVLGTRVPPDATFTLRLADGVVKGYEYNGTRASPFTNFYGLYDHHYSYQIEPWTLPDRWLSPPDEFDLETPLNLVSTNDITGGNSGSPLLNKDLEVVGLIFDSNIEALPNEYLYTDKAARAISVDARGIMEVLDDFYGADRIAIELRSGELLTTEEQADARATSSSSR